MCCSVSFSKHFQAVVRRNLLITCRNNFSLQTALTNYFSFASLMCVVVWIHEVFLHITLSKFSEQTAIFLEIARKISIFPLQRCIAKIICQVLYYYTIYRCIIWNKSLWIILYEVKTKKVFIQTFNLFAKY